MPSFLLSAETDPNGASITAWLWTPAGTLRRKYPYQPSFLIAPLHRSLREAEKLLAGDRRIKAMRRTTAILWLKGHHQEVLEVQPIRFSDTAAIANLVRQKLGVLNYELYNVDIPIPSRWMHENGLFPFAKVEEVDGRIMCRDDRWQIPYDVPDLDCVRLEARPDVRGAAPSVTDPIAEIRWNDTIIPARGREADALRDLQALIDSEDPDVYFTVGGDRWDLPYLFARIQHNGLRHQVNLGRLPDPEVASQKERSFHTYGHIVYRSDAWFLRGRLHIDLAKKFLPDSADRTSLDGIIYLARTSNSDPQRLARNSPGSCIQQTQIDRAREEGVQIPWKRNLVERVKTFETMCSVDRGGQVHVPDAGVYDQAFSVDFSGFYPSLIVANNLSSETINCDCCPDSDATVPGTSWHICKRRDGHQARTLRSFVEHRRYVKAILKRADASERQKAWATAIKDELKAIGVVCFGYARYKHARFGCAEVHQAIQALGRHHMTRAKRIAEDHGFERLHTLTDGMIIRKPGATAAEVEALCRTIARDARVPIETDASFDWVVLLPSKMVPGIGVPNRYYGKRSNGEVKVRGIELRRHNTCTWLADAQTAMLDVLATATDADSFHGKAHASMQAAKDHLAQLPHRRLEDLAMHVTITRTADDYTQETHTKIALQKLQNAGIAVQPGQTVSYVVLRGDSLQPSAQRAVPVQLLHQPGTFQATTVPDRDHYATLLARSMETLLAPLGITEADCLAFLVGRRPRQTEQAILAV